MSAEDNKALVRRFYDEIDKRNLAAMDQLVAEDYIDAPRSFFRERGLMSPVGCTYCVGWEGPIA